MDKLKNAVGDAGTFLSRAVQVGQLCCQAADSLSFHFCAVLDMSAKNKTFVVFASAAALLMIRMLTLEMKPRSFTIGLDR